MVDSLNLKIDYSQRFFFPQAAIRIVPPQALKILIVILHMNLMFKVKKINYQERFTL